MLELFKLVKQIASQEQVCIDNAVFRLHSRATVFLLSVAAMLVTLKQYFGEPIACIMNSDVKNIPKESLNAYCWVFSTFTDSSHLKGIIGVDNAGPGITSYKSENIIEQRYYKWVCFFLAAQALIFYAPRALWGIWEKNTVDFLTKDLQTPIPDKIWFTEKKSQLINYFTYTHLHSHNIYALRFLFCELLNFFNAGAQIYFLDRFLDGQFSLYGPASAAFSMESDTQKIDPMARLFPLVGKCSMYYYGSSGTVQNVDALCVMTLNIINEKIFVFLWFWLIFLVLASALAIIYRIVVFCLPCARLYLTQAQTRNISRQKIKVLIRAFHFGDWFLLHQLAPNVNPIVYREFVDELATTLSSKHYEAQA